MASVVGLYTDKKINKNNRTRSHPTRWLINVCPKQWQLEVYSFHGAFVPSSKHAALRKVSSARVHIFKVMLKQVFEDDRWTFLSLERRSTVHKTTSLNHNIELSYLYCSSLLLIKFKHHVSIYTTSIDIIISLFSNLCQT